MHLDPAYDVLLFPALLLLLDDSLDLLELLVKLASRCLVPELTDTLRPSTAIEESLPLSRSKEEFDTLLPSRMVVDPKHEELVLADVVAVDGDDIEIMVNWDEDRVHSEALPSGGTI